MTMNPKLKEIAEKYRTRALNSFRPLEYGEHESIEKLFIMALTEYSAEVEKKVEELQSQLDTEKAKWFPADAHAPQCTCRQCNTEKERDSALDMLQLILPMAKGYAAEHQVGNNQKFVEQAEKLLKS